MAVIMLEEDGMNRIAIYTGANDLTTPADAENAFEGKEYNTIPFRAGIRYTARKYAMYNERQK